MSVEYEISAKVGQDKNEKPIYRKIGVVIKTQKGAYMMKIEAIPVVGWDGWAYLNPPQANEQKAQDRPKQQQKQQGGGAFDDLDDDGLVF